MTIPARPWKKEICNEDVFLLLEPRNVATIGCHMWKLLPPVSREEWANFKHEFERKARFLVDESLGVEAAEIIRGLGWSAKYVGEVGLSGRDDSDIFSYAWKDDRIILTHDSDFLDDHRFPFYRNPGVIVLPGGAGSSGELEQALADVLHFVAPYRGAFEGIKLEITDGRVWVLKEFLKDEGRLVRRRLKLGSRDKIWEWESRPTRSR